MPWPTPPTSSRSSTAAARRPAHPRLHLRLELAISPRSAKARAPARPRATAAAASPRATTPSTSSSRPAHGATGLPAQPPRRLHHVRERGLDLGPAAGLEAAVWGDPQPLGGERVCGLYHQRDNDVYLRHVGRLDVVAAWADLDGIVEALEDFEQLDVCACVLDGNDGGVHRGDVLVDVVVLRVALVWV